MQCYNSIIKKQSLMEMNKDLTFNLGRDYYGNPIKILSMKQDAVLNCDLPGYLITEEGIVIPVVEGDEHGLVASAYLQKVLGKQWNNSLKYLYLNYLYHLHVILYGKMESSSFGLENLQTDYVGLFFLYDHLHTLSSKQREVISKIENTMFQKNFTPLYSVNNNLYDTDAEKLEEAKRNCKKI